MQFYNISKDSLQNLRKTVYFHPKGGFRDPGITIKSCKPLGKLDILPTERSLLHPSNHQNPYETRGKLDILVKIGVLLTSKITKTIVKP